MTVEGDASRSPKAASARGPSWSYDTIAGLATPPGRGGLAVLRVSGTSARPVAESVFRPSSGTGLRPRHVAHGHLVLPELGRDEATAVWFAAPASFTGEDVVELGVHGSPWIVEATLQLLVEAGARRARPGEFSHRAWLNGRLDVTQAEALDSLIRASSTRACAVAIAQAEGRLGAAAERLRELLIDALAELEAAVDFHDDSVGQRRIDQALGAAAREAARWGEGARRSRPLADGARIVLRGPVNAGKSSLFNALCGFERAIVSNEEGTTRDVLEATVHVEGLALTLVDTAGEREPTSAAESEGVRRARREGTAADLVLHVRDRTSLDPTEAPHAGPRDLLVLTKCDLDRPGPAPRWPDDALLVSSRTGMGLDALRERLARHAEDCVAGEGPTLLAARQRAAALRVDEAVQRALADRRAGHGEEIVAEGVREGLEGVGELLGAWDAEEVYGRIFQRFCIGK